MWTLNWDSTNKMATSSCDEVIRKINELNQKYRDIQPIIVQIESDTKKSLTIGIGAIESLSCLSFFPLPNGLGSMHLVLPDKQEDDSGDSIIFWLDSYDSEWEIKELVTYEEALNEVLYFLQNDDINTSLEWVLD